MGQRARRHSCRMGQPLDQRSRWKTCRRTCFTESSSSLAPSWPPRLTLHHLLLVLYFLYTATSALIVSFGLEHPNILCVLCSKSATQICNGCAGGLDPEGGKLQEIFYCGAKCQNKHWPSHAKECMDARDRRCVYRAGSLAQALFYRIRERLWSTPIVHIHKHQGLNLHIFEGSHDGNSHTKPFQYVMVKHDLDKNAVLAFMTCRTVLVYLEAFIKEMLRGKSPHQSVYAYSA